MASLTPNKVEISFHKKANVFANFRKPMTDKVVAQFSHTFTHTEAFKFIEANRVEAFLFRIDRLMPEKTKAKLIAQIESMGFTVEASNVVHYTQYAWR